MAASEPSKDGKDSILEPLCFPDQPADISSPPGVQCPGSEPLVCLFCSESVPPPRKDVLLRHLLMEHKLVIADVKLIADVPKYLLYWKGRFLEQPLTDFCSVIKTNSTAQSRSRRTTSCCVTSFQKTESSERSCSRNDWRRSWSSSRRSETTAASIVSACSAAKSSRETGKAPRDSHQSWKPHVC
uniref:zinc finger protein 277-like n=1 Tax=Maylandia zebra TaxID=106582 RepID=UPI000D31D24B|nr:zinc finger protein 277-like [Maylandia zebra]